MFTDDRPINAFSPLSVGKNGFTGSELLQLYQNLLLPRVIEKKMLSALRQGRISKWFSGYGQEIISVAAAMAMQKDEYICTMHRNLGVFTTRRLPLNRLFAQFMGKMEGYTQGRDRSFHFGTQDHKIVGMISHLGPQLGIADGIALKHKLNLEQKAVLVFTGDGATSEGDFHEALNIAAVWSLPVIFVIENNYWGLSTPYSEQYAAKQFIDKAAGFGMDAVQLDGNNPTEMLRKMQDLAHYVRMEQKPMLVEAVTFRLRGHEEASGTAYYPEGIIEAWERRDGILALENLLKDQAIATSEELEAMEADYGAKVKEALNTAMGFEEVTANPEKEKLEIYAPYESIAKLPSEEDSTELRFIDAIQSALDLALDTYPNLVFMGQDIAEYGGVFKATDGLVGKYGKGRVRNTPLCESGILGTALGLSINGAKAMVEMQFSDFVSCGMTQIANNLAKIYYRWKQNADVVIRMPTGAGVGAGPYHSQSTEAWFAKIPGLKVFYPSNPIDAKGMLLEAFQDPNPVLFFEHKNLYRTQKAMVPNGYYTVESGKAVVAAEGKKVSVITYGWPVHWALEAAEQHGDSVEVIDLRSLVPLDMDTVIASVNKCGRALVLQEDTESFGIAGEIVARIQEACFFNLDAPVRKIGSLDTPVPFATSLETQFLPKQRFFEALEELLKY